MWPARAAARSCRLAATLPATLPLVLSIGGRQLHAAGLAYASQDLAVAMDLARGLACDMSCTACHCTPIQMHCTAHAPLHMPRGSRMLIHMLVASSHCGNTARATAH